MSVSAPLFALPRLATSFVGTAIVTLTLPQMVVAAVGDGQKGAHLGAITATASLASLAALYLAGSHSDRHRHAGGRLRLPAVWLAVMTAPLLVLALGASYPAAVAAVLALVVARSLCDAAHLPIVADDLRGRPVASASRLSAHVAFFQFLGTGLGAAAFAVLPAVSPRSAALRASAAPIAVGLALLSAAGFLRSFRGHPRPSAPWPSPPAPDPPPDDSGRSRSAWLSPDLRSLLAARTLFTAGLFTVSTFLVFLVRDVLAAPDVERTTAILFGGTIAGALASALPAGRISEKVGDKRMLFGAGLAVSLVAPAFVVLAPQRPLVAVACMLLYGAAFGVVATSGLSLTFAVIDDPSRAGRIIALASATTLVAQALASAAGALVLDPLNRLHPNAGYLGLVALLEVLIAAGGLFLARVHPAAPAHAGIRR